MTIILIVIGTLGTDTSGLLKGLEELEMEVLEMDDKEMDERRPSKLTIAEIGQYTG